MTDDVTKAIARMRDQMANGDPDWWRDEELILRHIDGEPARLAAAREEQREACAQIPQHLAVDDGHWQDLHSAVMRSPLTTLLADEIAALRARVAYLEGELHENIGENADLVVRAARAEAERDALEKAGDEKKLASFKKRYGKYLGNGQLRSPSDIRGLLRKLNSKLNMSSRAIKSLHDRIDGYNSGMKVAQKRENARPANKARK